MLKILVNDREVHSDIMCNGLCITTYTMNLMMDILVQYNTKTCSSTGQMHEESGVKKWQVKSTQILRYSTRRDATIQKGVFIINQPYQYLN
jgi:hypothetical protein